MASLSEYDTPSKKLEKRKRRNLPWVPCRDLQQAGYNIEVPRDGGAQERVLAEKFRKFAEDCKIDWPKTSAWLRKVSLGYEEDAKREDLFGRV